MEEEEEESDEEEEEIKMSEVKRIKKSKAE